MRGNESLNRIAWKLGVSNETVSNAYKLFWRYVYDNIMALDVHNPDTYKRASYNIPSLGKLLFNERKLNTVKRKLNGENN